MIGTDERQPRLLSRPDCLDVDTTEWEYSPGNGTRYHGWCVRLQDGRTLVAVEPTGNPPYRSWHVFHEGVNGFLSWDYTNEKLRPAEGDLWAIQRFVAFMIGCDYSEAPYGERP
jgi:hypothetical protein